MASPGMLQSGLSRELFEMWCTDPRNTVVLAGYCVEGTLAKHIMSEPQEVTSISGRSLPLKMSVHYISFSAHSDFIQTAGFVDQLQPPNIILVHGDRNEMNRLKLALVEKYAEKQTRILTPRNCQPVTLQFKTEKMCRVLGTLADKYHEAAQAVSDKSKTPQADGGIDDEKKKVQLQTPISGVLVSRDGSSEQTLVELTDLHSVTQLTTTEVLQTMRIPTNGVAFDILLANLMQVYEQTSTTQKDDGSMEARVLDQVSIKQLSPSELLVEWGTSPMSDMIADSVIALLAHCQTNPFAASAAASIVSSSKPSPPPKKNAAEVVEELGLFLAAQFGEVAVDPNEGTIRIIVDNHVALYHHDSHVLESTDEDLAARVSAALINAKAAMAPISDAFPRPAVSKMNM
jgi:cleavage and polyadenylation specificity factor subunit 3